MKPTKKKTEKAKKDNLHIKRAGEDILTVIKELITGQKNLNTENEYILNFYESKSKLKQPKKVYSRVEKITFATIIAMVIHVLLLIARYAYAYSQLQEKVISNNVFYILVAIIIPFVVWIRATDENFWAFHKRKRVFFYLCCINAMFIIMQPVYTVIRNVVVPAILKIPTNPVFTGKMVMLLGHIATAAALAIICYILYIQLEPLIKSENLKKDIELFKLQHVKDNREDREYKYDIKAIKSLDTGKPIVIKQNDRFLQVEINGASGTGKTSTIFEGVIKDDMDQKVINREKRQEAILQMIRQKKATIQGPLSEFNELAVVPIGKTKADKERNAKQLSKIRKTYEDCGATIVAPNASMIEDIIKICAAREICVNVIDPVYSYEAKYENVAEKCLNPFYIPLGLPENERVIRISEAAGVFADVLIATNQIGGDSDVYFTDISLSVSSNIAAVVMLAKNIQGKQAYIDDIQECINNFSNLKPHVEIIEQEFGISVEASSAGSKGGEKLDADSIRMARMGNSATPTQRNAARKNPYYYQILFVKQELLGAGADDMFSQARGLRNLINKIMANPRIKKKLSGDDENRLDFDGIMAANEITVVNTAIELGKNTSTSFGLFFLLLHQTSVLRRPVETRTPHFLWIDECAQYVHPFFDNVIALYRQYRVAAVLTLQTLTQLEKNSATAYLKNVFLGAGSHIVFGRLAPEEMKLYSEMSGIVRDKEEQVSTSQSSVFTSNPSYGETTRYTPTVTNVLEGSDMRLLDFLELTIFTVNSGRVLPGQLGRVFFINSDAFIKQSLQPILWEKLVPEAFKTDNIDKAAEEKKDSEAEKPKKERNVSTSQPRDTFAEEDTEILLTMGVEKTDAIESKEDAPVSLNDFYKQLLSGSLELNINNEIDASDDIDYAAANKQFNQKRNSQ